MSHEPGMACDVSKWCVNVSVNGWIACSAKHIGSTVHQPFTNISKEKGGAVVSTVPSQPEGCRLRVWYPERTHAGAPYFHLYSWSSTGCGVARLNVAVFPLAAAVHHAGETCSPDALRETYIALVIVTFFYKFTLKCSHKFNPELKFGNSTNKNRARVSSPATMWLSPV